MRAPPAFLALLASLALLAVTTLTRRAEAQRAPPSAEPWLNADEASLEDRFGDGDLDEEDLARLSAAPAGGPRARSGESHLLAHTWVSLVGFSRPLLAGGNELGGFVVVGLALDKIAEGPTHELSALAQDASPRAAPRPPPPPSAVRARLAIDAALARGAVRTAWRVAGIEVNDQRIDDMIARSRLSVLLPETRIRAMQVFQDGQHSTSYINESGTVVDTSGSTTTLEARFTWRFDRLLFAGDEPTLERVRLEREEARSRIGAHVLELLFAWQRALLDAEAADAGSHAETEAALRQYESEISLDVLTGGWFGVQPATRAAAAPRRPRE